MPEEKKKKEVEVGVNWSDLENRVTKLRGEMTKTLKITKEKLEDAAKKSGLPVTFKLNVQIQFDE